MTRGHALADAARRGMLRTKGWAMAHSLASHLVVSLGSSRQTNALACRWKPRQWMFSCRYVDWLCRSGHIKPFWYSIGQDVAVSSATKTDMKIRSTVTLAPLIVSVDVVMPPLVPQSVVGPVTTIRTTTSYPDGSKPATVSGGKSSKCVMAHFPPLFCVMPRGASYASIVKPPQPPVAPSM